MLQSEIELNAPGIQQEPVVESANPLFAHAFADLRGGPMIEAILWRHQYLKTHPGEEAVILTTTLRSRIVSATTVYTEKGRVFGSSNALWTHFAIPEVAAADLTSAEGRARAQKSIAKLRSSVGKSIVVANVPSRGAVLIAAEETGDYNLLWMRPTPGPRIPRAGSLTLQTADKPTGPFFPGSAHEILTWTFAALHDPDHAGMVPVRLGPIRGQGRPGDDPPFPAFSHAPSARRGLQIPAPAEFLAFDWDGIRYYFHPDIGTYFRPLPVNAVTGLPYLGLPRGALAECVYFCATFARQHPDGGAVLVAGDPPAAAYPAGGKLGLFIPDLGGTALTGPYLPALGSIEQLRQIRDQVVADQKSKPALPGAAFAGMNGGESDMDLRRAYLALQAAGVATRLREEGGPSLEFSWAGTNYVYAAEPASRSAALVSPALQLRAPAQVSLDLAIQAEPPPLPEMRLPAPLPEPAARPPSLESRAKVVVMPPYIVSTTRPSRHPWKYLALPGLEVLTRASASDVEWYVAGIRHGQALQRAVIPAEWFPPVAVANTVVLDDTDLASLPPEQIHTSEVAFAAPADEQTWAQFTEQAKVSGQTIATDGLTFALNANLYHVTEHGLLYVTIDIERLYRAAPPLPRWVLAGLVGARGIFRDAFLLNPSIHNDELSRLADTVRPRDSGRIYGAAGPATLWLSGPETRELLKADPKFQIPLLPLGQLFSAAPVPPDKVLLWQSEAGLLLRWGLAGPGSRDPVRSRAFLEFVRRCRREAASEALFTSCFGFGYAAMEHELQVFLKEVLAKPVEVSLDLPLDYPLPSLRPATPDEIGRMLGDWLRLQAEMKRTKDPNLASGLLNSAGLVMLRAYQEDNVLPANELTAEGIAARHMPDPVLRAVYGLYARDLGQDAKAREFLGSAVEAKVARPEAYQALAELAYAEALSHPAGAHGRINAAQAEAVLGPLRQRLAFPPASEAYDLLVDTWGRCETKAPATDLTAIAEGVALFPNLTFLAYKSALVTAQAGDRVAAVKLIDEAKGLAEDPTLRRRLQSLRAGLGAPAAAEER
jgi:hypothetical protein